MDMLALRGNISQWKLTSVRYKVALRISISLRLVTMVYFYLIFVLLQSNYIVQFTACHIFLRTYVQNPFNRQNTYKQNIFYSKYSSSYIVFIIKAPYEDFGFKLKRIHHQKPLLKMINDKGFRTDSKNTNNPF